MVNLQNTWILYMPSNLKYKLSAILGALLLSLFAFAGYAHPNKEMHVNEIRSALGFEPNQDIDEWLGFISSNMIDQHNPFYTELTEHFPGFKCKHRLLFHWNFNGKPWTTGLEKRIEIYARYLYGAEHYRDSLPRLNEEFLDVLRKEQKRRNGLINSITENLLGFASSGRDASFANFFAAMAYDLHLLGDYMSDNKDLNGLVEFDVLIGGIITTIARLDAVEGKTLVNAIRSLNKSGKDVQQRADDIMTLMQERLPEFIKLAQGGSIKRRIESRGYKFR